MRAWATVTPGRFGWYVTAGPEPLIELLGAKWRPTRASAIRCASRWIGALDAETARAARAERIGG